MRKDSAVKTIDSTQLDTVSGGYGWREGLRDVAEYNLAKAVGGDQLANSVNAINTYRNMQSMFNR